MSFPSSEPSQPPQGIMPVPRQLPVMILPGCTLLPHNILPLCIFEQRYRLMLEAALESERMFCIAMRKTDEEDPPPADGQPDDIHPHMTVGVVRACVANPDGTSSLLLQGFQRARLVRWHQVEPFRIADIEPAPATGLEHPDLPSLREALIEQVDEMQQQGWDISPQLIQMLRHAEDHQAVANIAGFHLVRCPELQQQLLATDSVPKRMELVLDVLRRVQAGEDSGDE